MKGRTGTSTSRVYLTSQKRRQIEKAMTRRALKTAYWKGERDGLMKLAREGDERASKELREKHQLRIITPGDG